MLILANQYQKRFYRNWVSAKGLHLARMVDKETDLQILTDKQLDEDFVRERVHTYRYAIESYIDKDRRFLTSLKPITVELNAPKIVKIMAECAKKANVGPMAAVAGAVAGFLGQDLLRKRHKEVIIENGGDIFLKIAKPRIVGIYTGRSKLWNKLRLKIKPRDTPIGICTSSGTISHSLSFGTADSVIILSKSPCLADAVATATANRINSKEDLQKAVDFAKGIRGVMGVVITIKNNLISWGRIEFVR